MPSSTSDALRAREKAVVVMDCLRMGGVHALNVGRRDLAAGLSFLEARSGGRGELPFLSANLRRRDGTLAFPDHRILGVGPLRIGVIGLTDDVAVGAEADFRVSDGDEVLGRLVPKLRPTCDLLVLLSDLGLRRDRRIPERWPQLDLILGAHGSRQLKWPLRAGRTAVYSLGAYGRYLGYFRFLLAQPGRSRGLMTEGETMRIATSLQFVGGGRAVDERGRPDLNLFRRVARGEFAGRLNEDVASFLRERVPWTAYYLGVCDCPEDEAVTARVERHKRAVTARQRPLLEGRGAGSGPWRGEASCKACHGAAHAFWQGTAHARAWERLKGKGRSFDPECFPCHVTGFVEKTVPRPDGLKGLTGVQCESCHGPARDHDRYGRRERAAYRQACMACHRGDFGVRFRFDRDFERVACSAARTKSSTMSSEGK